MPLLLVVEDAERLTDEESTLLATLAPRLPERTLVAICFRDPPGSRHPPLADLLGRGGVYELTRLVSLDALSREELGELVASMHSLDTQVPPDFVEALWQRTAGNPFFAREVLRDLDPVDLRAGRLRPGLPAGLQGVLRHRLGAAACGHPGRGLRGGRARSRGRADPPRPTPRGRKSGWSAPWARH